ncbi:signal peptidase I [Microbacterium sp.]|uniref:signal peptidase I n=1 Tax=Microbacterium sp. TaxID=51671 RepID=UPI002D76963B|nr:signal peptidase I [Microbacterium sp.]
MRAGGALAATVLPFALGVAVVLSIGVARVENDSMSPTLSTGDVLVFDRVAAPARGDIVIFSDIAGWSARPGAVLVKRVIGVAGDRVVCCEVGTGRLLVDGVPQEEPYETGDRPGGVIPFEVTVPEGAVWVMGDNRGASRDSRAGLHSAGRGAVPVDDVLGVVRFAWPAQARVTPGGSAAASVSR